MVTARLKGGLANMLFIIAAIKYLEKITGQEIIFYNIEQNLRHLNTEQKHNPSMNYAFEYKKIFKNFKWKDTKELPVFKIVTLPFEYVALAPIGNVKYDAFFQCEKYFNDRSFINHLFEPSDFVKDKLKKYNYLKKLKTCSIHIRRGDYLKFTSHPVQTIEYYTAAKLLIGSIDKYIVFSDDIKWCKTRFKGNKYIFIENEKDYVEMFIQANCNHNIIANSSFSWWGAYLNKDKDKKVITPIKWFHNNSKYSSKDIIPESWLKI